MKQALSAQQFIILFSYFVFNGVDHGRVVRVRSVSVPSAPKSLIVCRSIRSTVCLCKATQIPYNALLFIGLLLEMSDLLKWTILCFVRDFIFYKQNSSPREKNRRPVRLVLLKDRIMTLSFFYGFFK